MNVYDFDGTLYQGDSTVDFFMHCLRKYPRVAATLPRTGIITVGLYARILEKTQFKSTLYRFLTKVPEVMREVELFWSSHEAKIEGPCHPAPGDLVISASPEFLLRDVCERRGLELVASPVDPVTGHVLGPNCHGEEKVRRLRELFPEAQIECFFSDSKNDAPLAALASRAFLVKDGRVADWPE